MSTEEQVEALARVMSPAMGYECTLDELRAYATRILASDWLASLLDEARAEGRREALGEAVGAIRAWQPGLGEFDRAHYAPGLNTAARVVGALGEGRP